VGLIVYWTFDELAGSSILDKSSNGFNGVLMNAPTRVYSGAPIGDESIFEYQASWTGRSISLTENDTQLTINNIQGNPNGAHLYLVKDYPSQTTGISGEVSNKYFGVFLASLSTTNSFDLDFDTQNSCKIFSRLNNSISSWSEQILPLQSISNRIEVIKGPIDTPISLNLGEDELICPFTPKILTPFSDPSGLDFTWSDGSKNSSLLVNNYGKYWVKVSDGCSEKVDTINFTRASYNLTFNLGDDETNCPFTPRIISPIENPTGFEFIWNDGSKQSTFLINDYGKYWVSIKNECFQGSDTIEIFKQEVADFFIPNIITPNEDPLNQYFVVDNQLIGSRLIILNRWGKTVYQTTSYQNNWDGSGLPTGVYYYLIFGECIEQKKGWISIVR
jgi:gliding motility-associated-like protein